MTGDTYSLVLRLFMEWGDGESAKSTWVEMERSGVGPDQRSYTIMIHWFFDKGSIEEEACYFKEMVSKGMVPEPRTELLVNAINIKLENREREAVEMGEVTDENLVKLSRQQGRKHGKTK